MTDRTAIMYILGDDRRADHLGAAHPVLDMPNLGNLAAADWLYGTFA
jgi:hypothetical protein